MLDTISKFELTVQDDVYILTYQGYLSIVLGPVFIYEYTGELIDLEMKQETNFKLKKQMDSLKEILDVITNSENNAKRVLACKKLLTDPMLQIYITIKKKQMSLVEIFKLVHEDPEKLRSIL